MTRSVAAIAGVVRYEFLMQIHRRALWLVVLAAALLIAIRVRIDPAHQTGGPGLLTAAAQMSTPIAYFLPLTYGVLMSDRVPRERGLHMLEVLRSLPAGVGLRVWGKFLGAGLATALPLFLGYLAVAAFWALLFGASPGLIGAEALVFLGVTLPGLLFVAGWTLLSTELLPAPVFSVLFVGYWFWGNFMSPRKMPTLSCTLLTPAGGWAAKGLFHTAGGWAGSCDARFHQLSAAQGWLGIAVLLVGGLGAVVVAQVIAELRAARA
jgi:ABC-type transport system involved in multi-copper enzyme maturation permease subunit